MHLCRLVLELKNQAPYHRSHLQTRFFETGDNYYLGMEFTREYDRWKQGAIDTFVAPVAGVYSSITDKAEKANAARTLKRLRGTLERDINRLWYDACLEVIRAGDVYNPGGFTKVPRLYLIDSLTPQIVGALPIGESFKLVEPDELEDTRYEILACNSLGHAIVRDVEGHVMKMNSATRVFRGGNLTRKPDGKTESAVSVATFPVGHYVNHRAVRLNNKEAGYVFAFAGDEQSTPHFMRYSGLTGAQINAMLINNFIGDAIHGEPFMQRFRDYSKETNWSNGEVVQRGTGANYGVDGFLRPGFPYIEGIRYLHSKVIEWIETENDLDNLLSRDWKIKFAASFVPQGLEHNTVYLEELMIHL